MIKYNVLWACGLWLILSGMSACSSSNQELEPKVDPIIPPKPQDSSYVVGEESHISVKVSIIGIFEIRDENV